jgi:RNase P/RNase MRP subunit p29
MIMIEPTYLIYHDLIGFHALARHKSKDQEDFSDIGVIIDDTKNMLYIKKDNIVKKLVKNDYVFRIKLEDGMLEFNGSKIIGVPENRLRSLKKKKRLRR